LLLLCCLCPCSFWSAVLLLPASPLLLPQLPLLKPLLKLPLLHQPAKLLPRHPLAKLLLKLPLRNVLFPQGKCAGV
jgi:hypothetical protein